jgi:hypothetical protein
LLSSLIRYGIKTIEELICIPDLELIQKFNFSKDDLKTVRDNSLSYLRQNIAK